MGHVDAPDIEAARGFDATNGHVGFRSHFDLLLLQTGMLHVNPSSTCARVAEEGRHDVRGTSSNRC